MDGILRGLNDAQREAVTSERDVLQVLAPPGSGKTKTLTARVAYLIASPKHNFKPWNIIVCTFTVKAAREMQERIRGFLGERLEKKLNIGTFHAMALRHLRQYGKFAGLTDNFGVADVADSAAIVNRIIKQNRFTLDPKAARSRISSHKAKGKTSEDFAKEVKKSNIEQQEFSQVFTEYQAQLDACGLLDYDDILLRCVALLRSHPECVASIQAVLVDEFQDTNHVQYELMRLFAQRQNFITIVGDPDQSIYGWRSAEKGNLDSMKQRWSDTRTINLEENYRSSGAILHAAQEIIEQDETRPPKKLQATHTVGQRPVMRKLPSAKDEANWLASEIKRIRALTGEMLELSDFAVLLRSHPLSREIEAAFGRAGLAYRMVGGKRFYDRSEIKLVIDYLRVISQPMHSEAVQRIINVPTRGIGDKTVENLQREAQKRGVTLWNLVLDVARGRGNFETKPTAQKGIEQFVNIILTGQQKMEADPTSIAELMDMVLKKTSFMAHLKKDENSEERWANVEELLVQAAQFSSQLQEETSKPTEGEGLDDNDAELVETPLATFLANAALTSSSDQKTSNEDEKVHEITISTCHAAKGLEWPVVFVPACYDGNIPHSRAEDNDEERRILYVAMTRAQALLYLSCPLEGSKKEQTTLSTFLTQSGVSNFFEEHGPSLSSAHVQGMATTLRRDCPAPEVLSTTRAALELEDDNYWPVNGEYPLGVSSHTDWHYHNGSSGVPGPMRPVTLPGGQLTTEQKYSSFTPASGLISLKDAYQQNLDDREARQQEKLEKMAAEQEKKASGQAPKGRKRQIEGQGSIASFFAKMQRADAETPGPGFRPAGGAVRLPTAPLRDISNMEPQQRDRLLTKPLQGMRKPCTAPLPTFRSASSFTSAPKPVPDRGYVFLSSSPPPPDDEEQAEPSDPNPPTEHEPPGVRAPPAPSFKPASTYHATSVQRVAPTRRTLGTRRSVNSGWNARGGKR